MLIRSRTLTGLLFIAGGHLSRRGLAPMASSTHQRSRIKPARYGATQQRFLVFKSAWRRGIPFPEETHLQIDQRVDIDSDNRLTRKLLAKTRGRRRDCLGSEGIRLLALSCKMS